MTKKIIKRDRANDTGPIPRDIEIDVDDHGCWKITNLTYVGRYPVLKYHGQVTLGSRYFWVVVAGKELTPADTLRHSCMNSWCVNPDHLVRKVGHDVFDN